MIINNINKTSTIAAEDDDPQLFISIIPPFLIAFKIFYGQKRPMFLYTSILLHENCFFVIIYNDGRKI